MAGTLAIAVGKATADTPFAPLEIAELVDGCPSLAIDSQGEPHVLYTDFGPQVRLRYARRVGGTWQHETVYEGAYSRAGSLALDAADQPHVVFWHQPIGLDELRYASKVAGQWTTRPVAQTVAGQTLHSPWLALDEDGKPHVAYFLKSDGLGDLYLAILEPHTIALQTIEEDVLSVQMFVSLQMDIWNNPHLGYTSTAGRLNYAWENLGTWTITQVDASPRTGYYNRLVIDDLWNRHIIHQDNLNGHLKYSSIPAGGSSWTTEVLMAAPDKYLGSYCTISLDPCRDPHVTFHVDTDDELWYGVRRNGTWAFEEVDTPPGGLAPGISIAARGDCVPQIAYTVHLDPSTLGLMFAEVVDCNDNGIPDPDEIEQGLAPDCNNNGVPDACDLVGNDCNGNGVPDECDLLTRDCNSNGVVDDCDITNGTSQNCNGNNIPDECEADCNGSGTPDDCDVQSGFSQDCNGNLLPDECDVLSVLDDCNQNSTPDVCDVGLHFEMNGSDPNGQLGGAVASAGDFDADGFADIAVGAFRAGAGSEGHALVYRGGPSADAVADFTFIGEMSNDQFGIAVAGRGDFNGDTYDDIVVGAPRNDMGPIDGGRAYVFYGGPTADAVADVILQDFDGPDTWLGSSLAFVDLNDDGFDDVVAGAPGASGSGKAHVFLGGSHPAGSQLASTLTYSGASGQDRYGIHVANVGDLNGDFIDDLAVASYFGNGGDRGRVTLFFGRQGSLPSSWDLVLEGDDPGDLFGLGLAGAGDVNDDGFDDLLVGAPFADGMGADGGKAYLFLGGSSMDTGQDLVILPPAPAFQRNLGRSVSGAGDLNGDGFDDILVGEDGGNTFDAPGRGYVYMGGPAGPDTIVDRIVTGDVVGDHLGEAVSGGGDFDQDGLLDFVVGIPRMNSYRGATRVLDIMAASITDCNGNGVGDVCDIATGTSMDINSNDIPDECEPTAVVPAANPARWVGIQPNPFNPRTRLAFVLNRKEHVTLTLYDAQGRLVRTLADHEMSAGVHEIIWDGRTDSGVPASSGVYHALLRAESNVASRKLTLLK